MAGIDDIGNGSSGSFDFSATQRPADITLEINASAPNPKAKTRDERMMEDTRHLTKGGKDAAGPDPRIAEAEARVTKNNKTIYEDEASRRDVDRGEMSAYFEKSSNTFNIGPGLNLDSELVRKSLKARNIDAEELKGAFDYAGKQTITPELVPVMQEVFGEVVAGATKEVKQLVGFGNWKHLKPNEQDALIQMSYNLGKTKLSKFTKTLAGIHTLIQSRKGKAGEVDETMLMQFIVEEMADSKWAKEDVPKRAVRIQQLFAGGKDDATQRYLAWKNG